MAHSHLYAVFPVQVFGKMLSAINAAMLATGAAERKHQIGETALYVTLGMLVCQLIHAFEESQNLTIVFQETYHRLIQSCQFLVWLIPSRIVGAAAIKHITAAIAARILWNAFAIRKTEHANNKRTFAVILRECGGAVQRMGFINLAVGSLISCLLYTSPSPRDA